ncbi:MAG: hypothetical protein NVSMB24_07610 [Mucilaginibacter sp.]
MEHFTVRVEFQGAHKQHDFIRLHREMEKAGFYRPSPAHYEETVYHLRAPKNGLYDEGDDDATIRVLEAAQKAAANTGKKFSVLVTRGEGKREWYSILDMVKK